jgi:outer membrane autotransporter protein
LRLAERSVDSLISRVGVRFSRVFAARNGSWIPEVNLAWVHDFRIDDETIDAAYVGAPNARFAIDGLLMEQDGALAGAGISYRSSAGWVSALRYSGEFRDRSSTHAVIGELRYEF